MSINLCILCYDKGMIDFLFPLFKTVLAFFVGALTTIGILPPVIDHTIGTPFATTTLTREKAATDMADISPTSRRPAAPSTKTALREVLQKPATSAAVAPEMSLVPEPAPAFVSTLPSSFLNERVRASLVNIFCLSETGGFFRPVSASGSIIDERGVILTNAHVAQYFLLADNPSVGNIACTIRTGSPARIAYKAELLYLPPAWMNANAQYIVQDTHPATGEDDYALLRITSSARLGESLPDSFLALTLFSFASSTLENTMPILIAGYPAGFLGGITINRELWAATSFTTLGDIFTFKDGDNRTPDFFSLGGVIQAQEGSSGGAVVSAYDGVLLGVITTRTAGATTGERDVHALSIPYIDERHLIHTGKNIIDYLRGDIAETARIFTTETAPKLAQQLIDVIR